MLPSLNTVVDIFDRYDKESLKTDEKIRREGNTVPSDTRLISGRSIPRWKKVSHDTHDSCGVPLAVSVQPCGQLKGCFLLKSYI